MVGWSVENIGKPTNQPDYLSFFRIKSNTEVWLL